MIITSRPDIPSSEITDENLYYGRRQFLRTASAVLVSTAAGGLFSSGSIMCAPSVDGKVTPLPAKGPFDTDEKQTPYDDVTTYNNFYEFGTDKSDPAENSKNFRTAPWSVAVEGFVAKPATYHLEDFLKPHKMEDRIYRMRCVEGWSMVIPWHGFKLSELIKRVQPTSRAKYLEFTTLHDPARMPGQQSRVLAWPYVEGLRMDEAMHPLTILATGLYGKPTLPNQNGAPLRLVMPWKYGFKGIKSIVKIRFVEKQPVSTWSASAPSEYGFYSNVNPDVDHPRWSQKNERRIGEFFKRKTLPFNGYGDQVARLYSGMDLKKNF